MERRLILMRHAQSAAADKSISDHERPLTERGKREATEIAARLVKLGWTPELVIGSDATRTRQTWEAMKPSFQPLPPVRWTNSLYLAGVDAIEDQLNGLDDAISDILLLGHNPGWQAAIGFFSGRPERMNTGNAALLHGVGDRWKDATVSGNFELVQLLRPRSL